MARPSSRLAFGRTTAAFFGVAAVLLAVGVLAGCSVASGYVQKGAEVISADNLEEQHDRVIRDWRALTTAADNACAAQSADPDGTLVESPSLAYAATYREVWASYNARTENIFEAGFVGPPGYPKDIPNYVTGPDPDFCDVSAELAELKAQQ